MSGEAPNVPKGDYHEFRSILTGGMPGVAEVCLSVSKDYYFQPGDREPYSA